MPSEYDVGVPQQDVRIAVLLPASGSAQVAEVDGGWWTVVNEQVVFAIVVLGYKYFKYWNR